MFEHFVQLIVNGLITGSILALTGVGASLVFGIQRIANFAHGEYLTIGAYVAFVLVCLTLSSATLAELQHSGRTLGVGALPAQFV